MMRAVFGIDVSKASSEVAILVNGEKVHTMPNDAIGFARLLDDFYSRIPESFLKQQDGLRVRKIDVEKLALPEDMVHGSC